MTTRPTARRRGFTSVGSWGTLLGVAVLACAACEGEIDTNFGPAGGLEGKMLPVDNVDAGMSGSKHDASMMKKCVYKAPPMKEAGPAETAPADDGATDGAADEAAADDAGGADEAAAPEPSDTPEGGTGTMGGGDCKVSWSKDIYSKMGAAGAWQCASSACHGGLQSPVLTGSATDFYNTLAATMVTSTDGTTTLPFLLPCSTSPAKSDFVCVTASSNCGPEMPAIGSGAVALTPTDVANVKTWIACGSLNN
jgi:hypothetical protein